MGIKDFLDKVDEALNSDAITDSINQSLESINSSINHTIENLENTMEESIGESHEKVKEGPPPMAELPQGAPEKPEENGQ